MNFLNKENSNKKGLLGIGTIIGLVVAGILLIAFLVSSEIRWTFIGIGIVIGGFWALTKIKSQKTQTLVFIISLVVGAGFIFGGGVLEQTAFGGATLLSIDDVQIKDKGDRIRVYGVATGAEAINIDFSENDINKYIENEGYKATKGLQGDIRFVKQNKLFGISKTSNKFWRLDYMEAPTGVFGSCDQNHCENEIPSNAKYFDSGRGGEFVGTCWCVYKTSRGTNSIFTGASYKDFKVDFDIGRYSNSLTSDKRSISVGPNIDVEWTGDLHSLNEVNAPSAYNILFVNDEYQKLIDDDAYNIQQNVEQDTEEELNLLLAFNSDSLERVSNTYNYEVTNALDSKTSDYTNSVSLALDSKTSDYTNSVSLFDNLNFSGNNMVVELTAPESYPTFIMTIDAEEVGIIELKGEPKILNCQEDFEINSGNSKIVKLDVKNVGSNAGQFNGFLECDSGAYGNLNSLFFEERETSTMTGTFTGSNTDEGTTKDYNCKIVVKDQKSGKTDSCNFNGGVTATGNQICEPNSKVCIDDETLRVCNSLGTNYNDITCDDGCIAQDGKDACEGDEPDLECSWYQEPYQKDIEDCGFLGYKKITPFVSCETYTDSGCRTSGWVYGVIFGLVVTGLGVTAILVNQPSKKKKKPITKNKKVMKS